MNGESDTGGSDRPDPATVFREMLDELPADRGRELLAGAACPEPGSEPWVDEHDAVVLEVEGEAVVFRVESETAWVQSDVYVDLESAR